MSKMSEAAAALATDRKALRRYDEAFHDEFMKRYIQDIKKKDDAKNQPKTSRK